MEIFFFYALSLAIFLYLLAKAVEYRKHPIIFGALVLFLASIVYMGIVSA